MELGRTSHQCGSPWLEVVREKEVGFNNRDSLYVYWSTLASGGRDEIMFPDTMNTTLLSICGRTTTVGGP